MTAPTRKYNPLDLSKMHFPPPANDSLELIAQALAGIRMDLAEIRHEAQMMRHFMEGGR